MPALVRILNYGRLLFRLLQTIDIYRADIDAGMAANTFFFVYNWWHNPYLSFYLCFSRQPVMGIPFIFSTVTNLLLSSGLVKG